MASRWWGDGGGTKAVSMGTCGERGLDRIVLWWARIHGAGTRNIFVRRIADSFFDGACQISKKRMSWS